MSPNDPRHGTEAGDQAHRRDGEKPCDPCLRGKMRAQKLRRMGKRGKVVSLGSRRRIQALQAMGYSRMRIAQELGYTDCGALAYLMTSEMMTTALARRIASMYDRLSMTPPQGSGVAKAKMWAARNGFAPPLAWDSIDDPNEQPADWEYRPPTREEQLADWVAQGRNISQVCYDLRISKDSLERWCLRHKSTHLFAALTAREYVKPGSSNQYTAEAS